MTHNTSQAVVFFEGDGADRILYQVPLPTADRQQDALLGFFEHHQPGFVKLAEASRGKVGLFGSDKTSFDTLVQMGVASERGLTPEQIDAGSRIRFEPANGGKQSFTIDGPLLASWLQAGRRGKGASATNGRTHMSNDDDTTTMGSYQAGKVLTDLTKQLMQAERITDFSQAFKRVCAQNPQLFKTYEDRDNDADDAGTRSPRAARGKAGADRDSDPGWLLSRRAKEIVAQQGLKDFSQGFKVACAERPDLFREYQEQVAGQ